MLVSVIQKIYISIPNVLIVVFSSVSNFNFKFSLVTSYFQNFMFFPAKLSKLRTKNKNKQKMKFSGEFTNWLESGVPENTGMVTASLSCSCSAAVDAELAQDIQL